jgi:hypothetical protein
MGTIWRVITGFTLALTNQRLGNLSKFLIFIGLYIWGYLSSAPRSGPNSAASTKD